LITMSKINLLFGVNFHQPLGIAESVLDQAYRRCYLPFFETIDRHPRIKISFNMSGVLYDWILNRHPEFLDLLRKLIQRRQVEVFSGGYYQPILPFIPETDIIGQVNMQNEFIKKHLRSIPVGLWLAEKSWEPHLPKVLEKVGIEYTALDDYLFSNSGLSKKSSSGYYVTEEEGVKLNLFSISSKLSQLIPNKKPEDILAYLENLITGGGEQVVVFWGEGERFGFWPGSYRPLYTDRKLDNLFTQLEEHSSWIRSLTFCEYHDEHLPSGLVYLPTSFSYANKNSDNKSETERQYLKNSFANFAEANNLHKKMLYVSAKLEAVKNTPSDLLDQAKRELYMGQCGDAYWHAENGGINLVGVRTAAYRHLINAENLINKVSRGIGYYTEVLITDFNKDGQEEVLMSNDKLNVYFSPADGGSIFELDFKPKAHNLLSALRDHFFDSEVSLQQIRSDNYKELGDFSRGEYNFFPQRKNEEITVTFSRTGQVADRSGIKHPVKIIKKALLLRGQSILNIEYEISNLGEKELDLWFGAEFNCSLSNEPAENCYYEIGGKTIKDRALNSTGILYRVSDLKLVDGYRGFGVSLVFEKDGMLCRFPIERAFQTREGLKSSWQGLVLVPIWKLQLRPQASWTNKIVIRFET